MSEARKCASFSLRLRKIFGFVFETASMKEYFNEVGGDPPDLQTMIGIKANEGNKWENISKRNNEVKEGGRRKKRKKTRKGKKKKKRKKTRKK